MAAADPPPPTSGMGFFGMLSFRRSATAVASFDPAQDDELLALDALQSHVADRLAALSAAPLLSLPFLSKLLDAVVSSDAAFRAVLALAPVAAALARPPADRLAADLLDRAVKTLDVLNAASLTLASLRAAHRAALAAASCLLLAPALHAAHLARARRAIARLFPADDSASASATAASKAASPSSRTMRALSLSVSKNWSAGRHMNAMAAHLAPPSPAAAVAGAGCGLGLALYTMSSVLVFAMWALVGAVPCQDRASAASTPPVAPPKQAQWAAPMSALQDRIADEWRRKEKKGSCSGSAAPTAGLLAEMQAVERAARDLNSVLDEIAEEEEEEEDDERQRRQGIVGEERARDVTARAEELAAACKALEDGLAPLERQVRAVFHSVVACRAEVVRRMELSARAGTANAAAASASGVPTQHQHSF